MRLLQKIEEYTMLYNDSKAHIAEFVLQNKNNIHHFSMAEIAKQTYSSKATLVRFAQSLGFNGWRELMKTLAEELHYEATHYSDINPNLPFTKNDSIKEIVQKIATIQAESLHDTADRLDPKALEKATELLLYSQRIVLLGVTPNNFVGEIFRRKMISIGRVVEVVASGEMGVISYSLTSNDVAILISYAGNDVSREPMKFIPALKEKGVKLIGLTSEGNNYMRQEIDTILTISSREGLYKKISNFSTEESILFLLNVLYAAYFSKDYVKNYNYKLRNSIALEENRRIRQIDLKE